MHKGKDLVFSFKVNEIAIKKPSLLGSEINGKINQKIALLQNIDHPKIDNEHRNNFCKLKNKANRLTQCQETQ
jgi:hypothetical protein